MRVIIEVESEAELRRITKLLGAERFDVQYRDAAPATRADRATLHAALKRYHGKLPVGYRFDRDELHDRHG